MEIQTKRMCYKCECTLPLTEEFFAKTPRSSGFDRICKTCKAEYARERYITNPPAPIEQYFVGRYVCRYNKRANIWRVYWMKPWKHLVDLPTKEEALEWANNN